MLIPTPNTSVSELRRECSEKGKTLWHEGLGFSVIKQDYNQHLIFVLAYKQD